MISLPRVLDSEEDHYFLWLRREDLPNDRLQATSQSGLRTLLRSAR